MAQKGVTIQVGCFGDGTSTQFVFDLLSDPYGISQNVPIVNWFSNDRKASSPSGVFAGPYSNPFGGTYAAALSGNTLTLTFSAPPTATQLQQQEVILLF